MKLMFISDIHGKKTNLAFIRDKFRELNCDKLVVLGDVFYNSSYDNTDYDPEFVENFLKEFKGNLICSRGNCDNYRDLILLNEITPVKELDVIRTINNDIYITHGHIYNDSNWDKTNSILVFGHFHVPFIRKIESNYYINPGSISIPRGNNPATFLVYDEEKFTIYDTSSNIITEERL